MSKQKTSTQKASTPPHSLELRAKRMKMPVTAGVHIASVGDSTSSPVASETKSDSEDSDISPRLSEIHAAISRVDLDDKNAWTKNGGPKVSTLEKLLGYQITEAERDAAWHLEIGE